MNVTKRLSLFDGLNLRRKVIFVLGVVALLGVTFGAAYAAFMDTGEVQGSTISVGSADIKLFLDVSGPIADENLVESLPGPNFDSISQNWTDDYLLKIFNNASAPVDLSSWAFYETANDPSDLRQDVNIEIIEWNDINHDGIFDVGEEGVNYGKKTIVKWKTEGFNLMSMASGDVMGLVLRFSVENLSDTKQGASMIFDFEFDAVGHE